MELPTIRNVMLVTLALAGTAAASDTVLLSSTPKGASADEESGGIFGRQAISRSGRYVAFESRASDLGPGDMNNDWDIYVWDRKKDGKVRASVAFGGDAAGASGLNSHLSANGRFVAFQSSDTDLVDGGDAGFDSDIFVRDLKQGVTTRVSVDSAGLEAAEGQSHNPFVSASGRWVVFQADAPLAPDDDNELADVYLHDRKQGTTVRVSVDSAGAQVEGDSLGASVSANGRYVVFESTAPDLVENDLNGDNDIFLRDTKLGTTVRLSVNAAGEEGDNASTQAMISGNGRYVVFASAATNLDDEDGAGNMDVFLRDLKLGTIQRVTVNGVGDDLDGNSSAPSITHSGRHIAWESDAPNVPIDVDDANGVSDVFLLDLKKATVVRASVDAAGLEVLGGPSFGAVVSGNGRFIAFESDADDLVPDDGNEARDVFLRDVK